MLEFLNEHLKAGRIRPSKSHVAASTWMIPKDDPDDMPRVVHDYRELNSITVKDHIPLPRQEDIMRSMARAKVRGKVDFICAYYQILMDERDVHKTAFKTPYGLFEWLVMSQGLCNAVAMFQWFVNYILLEAGLGECCQGYVDDIAIRSDSIEEHMQNVRKVLDVLREHGLIASACKSMLVADRIEFLGHIISSKGIEVHPDKVDKIIAVHPPRSSQDVKEFKGLVNYIGQFIPGLSHWSTVLSSLT